MPIEWRGRVAVGGALPVAPPRGETLLAGGVAYWAPLDASGNPGEWQVLGYSSAEGVTFLDDDEDDEPAPRRVVFPSQRQIPGRAPNGDETGDVIYLGSVQQRCRCVAECGAGCPGDDGLFNLCSGCGHQRRALLDRIDEVFREQPRDD